MDRAADHIDTIAKTCIAVRVRILNRVMTNLYDGALRPLGLKVSQMNILVVVAKIGLARPGRICELLHLDASTLSRNVERMIGYGWLEIVREEDARAQPIRVTAKGLRLIERATPAWEQAQRRAKHLLGADGVAALDRAAGSLQARR